MPAAPIHFDLRVTRGSARGTIANLRQYGTGLVRDVQVITEKSGRRALRTAKRLAPVSDNDPDLFHMRDHIHLVISAKRLAWQLGYDESDFVRRGLAFYAVFQELGFHHWISGEFIQNPHIRPAHALEAARYASDIAAAARRRAAMMRRN